MNEQPELPITSIPEHFCLVRSGQIKAIGYFTAENKSLLRKLPWPEGEDADPNSYIAVEVAKAGRLEVLFMRDGARWAYFDVPSAIVQEMLEAESLGSYFSKNIKKNPEAFAPSRLPDFLPTVEGDGQGHV